MDVFATNLSYYRDIRTLNFGYRTFVGRVLGRPRTLVIRPVR